MTSSLGRHERCHTSSSLATSYVCFGTLSPRVILPKSMIARLRNLYISLSSSLLLSLWAALVCMLPASPAPFCMLSSFVSISAWSLLFVCIVYLPVLLSVLPREILQNEIYPILDAYVSSVYWCLGRVNNTSQDCLRFVCEAKWPDGDRKRRELYNAQEKVIE